jgi:hypothetical protein
MCCLVRTTVYVKGSHRLVRGKYEHCLGKQNWRNVDKKTSRLSYLELNPKLFRQKPVPN